MGRKKGAVFLVILLIFLAECSSISASPASTIISGVVSKVVSNTFKRLWSLKSTTKTAVSSRSMMKFEGGYTVETVFDGSKHGNIEPYTVKISPDGELLILDSHNSNIYKISTPLTRHSRPKLLAGSAEGYTGHVDGKLRQARLNHPRGLTVDDNGNVYVADTMNMAIRKISDSGVVTIAGGKLGRGGGHVDGPSEDAKFSDDFDLVYVGSSCSILVVDRGNQAIREMQLHEDDCSPQEDSNLHLGIAVLAAASFFGYMLALLQRRIATMLLHDAEAKPCIKAMPPSPYERPPPTAKSVLPPLIPSDDKQEDGVFSSIGKLFVYTISEIFGGLFPGFTQHYQYQSRHGNGWAGQERLEDGLRQPKQKRSNQWNGELQQHHKYQPSSPQTYYEAQTNEIVFGAVQEQDPQRGAMVIKAVDYNSNNNVRSRYNYMSYSSYGY